VDFKNTVIIMTSNVGSQWLQDIDSMDTDEVREKVITALRQQFRPEFINRIDDIIIFNRLGIEEIKQIVELQLTEVSKRLAEKRIGLVLTEVAKKELAEQGFDRVYGARPLKRTIQRVVLDPLAMQMLEGKFIEGDNIEVDFDDGKFVFRRAV
jgi:ATP-dependent Clp protease ATP-binding subunit ClpB